ncbi:hypothetical protein HYC85_008394 [Camellia sinensis]|uniref:Cytochrome P450 n=1 Tax=Camellia sinensis TaxID=4442 RepID=A0A7J7HU45_CAMSI|nr:hypothetical protein HYC85_008394 [Camellia sinensis]
MTLILPSFPYSNVSSIKYPPVPLVLPHYSSEDCTIDRSEEPHCTILLVNALVLHRDPKVWEELDKFKPERFEGEREGFKFVPFGIRRRMSPGCQQGCTGSFLGFGLTYSICCRLTWIVILFILNLQWKMSIALFKGL